MHREHHREQPVDDRHPPVEDDHLAAVPPRVLEDGLRVGEEARDEREQIEQSSRARLLQSDDGRRKDAEPAHARRHPAAGEERLRELEARGGVDDEVERGPQFRRAESVRREDDIAGEQCSDAQLVDEVDHGGHARVPRGEIGGLGLRVPVDIGAALTAARLARRPLVGGSARGGRCLVNHR